MNYNLHFGESHSDNSINDKIICLKIIFQNDIEVKRSLISFNCFSEYILFLELEHIRNIRPTKNVSNHQSGLELYHFVRFLICYPSVCLQAVNAQASVRGCACSPEP